MPSTYYSSTRSSTVLALAGTCTTTLTQLTQTDVTASDGSILGVTDIYNRLQLEIKNTSGSIALNGFSIDVKATSGAGWVPICTSTAAVSGFLLATTGEVNALAAGASQLIRLDIGNCYAVRIRAKSASSTVAVTAKGYAWQE